MITITPPTRRVKKTAGIMGPDLFGFGLGGGCLLTLLDLLFGISGEDSSPPTR